LPRREPFCIICPRASSSLPLERTSVWASSPSMTRVFPRQSVFLLLSPSRFFVDGPLLRSYQPPLFLSDRPLLFPPPPNFFLKLSIPPRRRSSSPPPGFLFVVRKLFPYMPPPPTFVPPSSRRQHPPLMTAGDSYYFFLFCRVESFLRTASISGNSSAVALHGIFSFVEIPPFLPSQGDPLSSFP